MDRGWEPKPGDSVFRRPRLKHPHLRRVLGIPALFSAGYGDVGSSIYYALGIVALVAVGATPIVLAAAGIIYIFNALTYAEGSAMFPEAGGSAAFARHGFNELVSFISGWALMLSYIVTIAISAYTIPPYLAHFWSSLNDPVVDTGVSMGIILFLMFVNVIGIRESSRMNISFIGIDIATQVSIIVLGIWLILAVNPGTLFQNMFGEGNWPTTEHLIFGIAIAALAFTGVETVSQIAEEARHPSVQAPRTYILMIITVLALFAGISIVALSAMTPQELGDPVNGWARDPVAGIAANLPSETLRTIYSPLVAVLAATILLTASNAGMMGISRLAFSLASHRQMPSALSRVHERFRTPYISIILFSIIALCVLIPGFFTDRFFTSLGALYAFGSLLTFALAHISLLKLRVSEPEIPRPFKLGLNIGSKGREIPITAALGAVATVGIWLVIIIVQPYSRVAGFSWMVVGLIVYYIYRRRAHLPLTGEKEKGM